MSFMDAVSICFKKYADFTGRARRSEYWYFWLFTFIVSLALTLLLGEGNMITDLFSLAMLIPFLAVGWRRMHDIGKSGAMIFLSLIPLVGTILIIVWCCQDSQPGANIYGENPKA